jgi:endonuclease G, mitochondrial
MKRVGFFLAVVLCIVWLGASAVAQTVVVNKYQNSGTTNDVVELLVVQDKLDMRGMIIKDFSASMASDGGGKYQFSNDALWSSVRAGTLIVLRNNNSAADVSVGGSDYNLDLGMQNPTYFSSLGGAFDIATTEMVMIKSAGSGAAGVSGSIHALAGGTAGTQFTSAPTPKLRAAGTAGAGQFVYANNGTQSLADFNGTDATGAAASSTFGSGNNANNTAFISSLRAASVVNEPTVQASNVAFSSVGTTSLTVNWTSGNGSGRVVQIRESGPVNSSPADGTSYPANPVFGNGAQTGAGDFVVYAGSGNSVNVTGLKPNTFYYFAVSEFNGSGSGTDYLTTAPATGNQQTTAAYNISGHIQDSTGIILSGVNITLTGGPATLNATTDYGGNYLFANLTAGVTYTATPSMSFYSFSPPSQTVKFISNDEVFNFIATSSAPQDCTYTVSPASQNFPANGGGGNISLTTGKGCGWKARASANWIKISDTDGYGSANVSYYVSANSSSTSARTLTVDVAGQVVTITQDAAAPSCSYNISPATDSFGPTGGVGMITITTDGGCAWTAVTDAAWITINGAASGAGNGTISYSVGPNTGFFRTGTLTLGGKTLTIEQKGDGTAPPASTSVHLTMGNPSRAATDVNQPLNYLLDKTQYAVSYNRDSGRPNWVSWHLNSSWIGSASRQNDFRNDTSLPSGWYQVTSTDYTGSGFDRGHHTPSADRTNTVENNSATFFMTNMMPQAPDNNQGPWEVLESYTRTLVSQGNEVYIIAGGTGIGGTGSNGGVTNTVANGHVTVPAQTWKVIIVIPDGDNDVSRVNTQTRVVAVIMPNQQGIRANDWKSYRVSVDQVEALTGYDFFSNVPVDIQSVIEASVDNQ